MQTPGHPYDDVDILNLICSISGALFAASGILERASGLIGNIVLNTIYAETLHFFKGFVFIILAAMLLVTAALMMYVEVKVIEFKLCHMA